jgi:hypothetical protein
MRTPAHRTIPCGSLCGEMFTGETERAEATSHNALCASACRIAPPVFACTTAAHHCGCSSLRPLITPPAHRSARGSAHRRTSSSRPLSSLPTDQLCNVIEKGPEKEYGVTAGVLCGPNGLIWSI